MSGEPAGAPRPQAAAAGPGHDALPYQELLGRIARGEVDQPTLLRRVSDLLSLVDLVGTPFPHIHELISGQNDTGVYVWNPVSDYASGTVGTGDLGGYYIKVTVTDASGAEGSDSVPIRLRHP